MKEDWDWFRLRKTGVDTWVSRRLLIPCDWLVLPVSVRSVTITISISVCVTASNKTILIFNCAEQVLPDRPRHRLENTTRSINFNPAHLRHVISNTSALWLQQIGPAFPLLHCFSVRGHSPEPFFQKQRLLCLSHSVSRCHKVQHRSARHHFTFLPAIGTM